MMAGAGGKTRDQLWNLQSEAAVTLTLLSETANKSNQTDDKKGCVYRTVMHDDCRPVNKRRKLEDRELQITESFPQKLLGLLENKLYREIISWHPNDKIFVINDWSRLASEVFPKHGFKPCSFNDFTTELCLWGFQKVSDGDDRYAYTHEIFNKGDFTSCLQMNFLEGQEETLQIQISKKKACKEHHGHDTSLSETTVHQQHWCLLKDNELPFKPEFGIIYGDYKAEAREDIKKEIGFLKKPEGLKEINEQTAQKYISNEPLRNNDFPPVYSDASTFAETIHLPINTPTSLDGLIGMRQSPIISFCNYAAQRNLDLDLDALTETLLRHHHEKLSLRTAILSQMLHALEEQKRNQSYSTYQSNRDLEAHASSTNDAFVDQSRT